MSGMKNKLCFHTPGVMLLALMHGRPIHLLLFVCLLFVLVVFRKLMNKNTRALGGLPVYHHALVTRNVKKVISKLHIS